MEEEQASEQSSNGRMQVWISRSRAAAPYALTALVTFLVVMATLALTREEVQVLTPEEVDQIALDAITSATPPPAKSAVAYQIILPSLSIIQTSSTDAAGEENFGIGTGVIVNRDATILTALHVVDGADEIQIIFADGTETTGVLIQADPSQDIAVVQPVDLPGEFFPATLGSAGALNIGDEVFAVGNPLGLVGSMSAGVVSGFDRTFFPQDSEIELEGLIQFDAAVNPGNSGGPLLNENGQVVGIVTGLINPVGDEAFVGIGFAVPIQTAVTATGGGGPSQ